MSSLLDRQVHMVINIIWKLTSVSHGNQYHMKTYISISTSKVLVWRYSFGISKFFLGIFWRWWWWSIIIIRFSTSTRSEIEQALNMKHSMTMSVPYFACHQCFQYNLRWSGVTKPPYISWNLPPSTPRQNSSRLVSFCKSLLSCK